MKKDFTGLDNAILMYLMGLPTSTASLAVRLHDLALPLSSYSFGTDRFKAERVIESRTQALRKQGKIKAVRRGSFSFWELV